MLRSVFPYLPNHRCGAVRWYDTGRLPRKTLALLSADPDRLIKQHPDQRSTNISFALPVDAFDATSIYVKIYIVRTVKQRFKEGLGVRHRHYGLRYGAAEAHNLLAAARLQVNCPELYAVGEVSNRWGTRAYIVVMEHLKDYRTLSEMLADGSDASSSLLQRTQAVIKALYRKGMFHIDLSSKNIMLSAVRPADWKVIDLEYVKFLSHPQPLVLAFQLGYLYRKWCRRYLESSRYDDWALGFLTAYMAEQDRDGLIRLYQRAKTVDFSRKRILSLV